eukprot:s1366_g16.t1
MDSRSAMTYHLGNALLHLQYLAGHMPWFVPPADVNPAPASVPASPGHHLTTFVPHPGRPSNPASSSRPITVSASFTRLVDDLPGTMIAPPPTPDPMSSSPNPHGHTSTVRSSVSDAVPVTTSSARPPNLGASGPTIVDRPPPRGLSISRSPPMPPPSHPPQSTSNPAPPSGDSAPSIPPPASSTPLEASVREPSTTRPLRSSSPLMAPERRRKKRRVSSLVTPGPSDDMPPRESPGFSATTPARSPALALALASSNPADSTTVHTSGHVLPITDSPPRDPGETGDAADSDSNDSHLSTRPPSGERPPAMSSTGPTAPPRDLFRTWAPVDDQELISYKRDTKARPSWKTIGQRLHRSAESCRARWLWLQSTGIDHTNVLLPRRDPET